MLNTKLFFVGLLAICLTVNLFAQKVKKPNTKTKSIEIIQKEAEVTDSKVVETKIEATPTPTPPIVTENIEKSSTNAVKSDSVRYRIGLLDQIEVVVYRHPELSMTVPVSEQGTIRLPRLTKPIPVLCKTETEVADLIMNDLKSFLREPSVNARVTQQNSQPFAVIGAVEKPGNFALNRSVTLLELISLAGGPDGERAGNRVQVARLGGVSGCEQNDASVATSDDKLSDSLFAYYKLKDVFENRTNPRMRPGDIVRVLEFEEFYVIGNVGKPQVVKYKDNMTVSDAIASAGGFLPASKKDKVIIRRKENGNQVDIIVDINKVEKKQARDVEIQPEDIVFVPTDKIKEGFFDLKKAITQGISTILRPF